MNDEIHFMQLRRNTNLLNQTTVQTWPITNILVPNFLEALPKQDSNVVSNFPNELSQLSKFDHQRTTPRQIFST